MKHITTASLGEKGMIKEIQSNLFCPEPNKSDLDKGIAYAQCISADFACGKGIALEFNRYFDVKRRLQQYIPDYVNIFHRDKIEGDCISFDNVYNLITKERYYEKPTLYSMSKALTTMREQLLYTNVIVSLLLGLYSVV